MSDDRTAFPDILGTGDPLAIEHDRLNREDPREASEVFPREAVPLPEVETPSPIENVKRTPDPFAESAMYKEHGFRWRARDMNSLPADASIVEIARWRCPAGHVGIVSHVATHFAIAIDVDETNPDSPVLEIGLNLPNQPWLHDILPLGDPPGSARLRWWLRLESRREREQLAAVWLRGASELPGQPFPELATWTDQRFAWHWHGREPLRLLVPEAHTLRLFVGLDQDPRPPSGGEMIAKLGTGSKFAIDVHGKAATSAIAVAAPDLPFEPSPTSSEARAEARASIEDTGVTVAGRLIGTLQTYREARAAIEAVRRGL